MHHSSDISRKQLEQSGEILREENAQDQSVKDEQQTNEWDSLKEVPFAGDKINKQEVQTDTESEENEEEMSM